MQKLSLSQGLQQKLSPQQIQFIKLLQIPTVELESRVEEELEDNPALEEGKDELEDLDPNSEDFDEKEESAKDDEINVEDYLRDDDISGYKMQGDGGNEEEREMPMAGTSSLNELLLTQLGYLGLDDRLTLIGKQLIGSIESDGYIRREMEAILNDLAFSQNVETDLDELESVLHKIQDFDPPGIAARDLRECLLLQLERKDDGQHVDVVVAKMILNDCYEEFTKKHYDKIMKKLDIEDEDFVKDALELIRKLNPKPGGSSSGMVRTQYLIPDFMLSNIDGEIEVALNSRNAPELRVSRSYTDMFTAYDKSDKKDKKLKYF